MNNKQPIGQTIVKRKYPNIDNIEDAELLTYEYLFNKESDEDFIGRVTAEANMHYECVLNISYLDRDTAIIIWKDISYKEEDPSIKYKEIKMVRINTQQYEDFILAVFKQASLFPNSKVIFLGDIAYIRYEV